MSQKWEKINQKFIWLKVASVMISISNSTGLHSPSDGAIIICYWMKLTLNRNWLLFKKITFKILNGYNIFQ